ncbi:zinc finger protein 354C-like [Esox lucius]|uniref:C2H2-type domain-containing protein n=1 Tax=Esox lucius TaxID=8010 RepID=A0A6Q2ZN70_ESOLU|nr:zinc finger protein 354C-like [Esox lucius]
MSKLQSLRVFLNERLTAVAVEIFGEVEKTVVGYQEENDRLRRMLRITQEISLCKIDLSSSEEVPPEQQFCEQEWSPSLWQEDPESTQIKEEQEELRTSQKVFQGLGADIVEFKFTPRVKSECVQEDPFCSLALPQTLTLENRENDSKQLDPNSFVPLTTQNIFNDPCDPPDLNGLKGASSLSLARSRDPEGPASSLPLDTPPLDPNLPSYPDPPLEKHWSNPGTVSRNTYCCLYCGETFVLKADLQRHVALSKKRPSECNFCRKRYNSTCKLKAHVRLCQGEKSCTCPFCGKTFKQKGTLSIHMRIHTGEKPFSCGNCGKCFSQKGHLTMHKLIHTGDKPFNCDYCGKSFSLKDNLTRHKLIHTGEKPYSCGDCGKSFNQKGSLKKHILTHTGEKPFRCDTCGKSFTQKSYLLTHVKNVHNERTL